MWRLSHCPEAGLLLLGLLAALAALLPRAAAVTALTPWTVGQASFYGGAPDGEIAASNLNLLGNPSNLCPSDLLLNSSDMRVCCRDRHAIHYRGVWTSCRPEPLSAQLRHLSGEQLVVGALTCTHHC